jgi:asparagine synthase (glutamine-hydrolysing)
LGSWLKKRLGNKPWRPPYPDYLAPAFAARADLTRRWDKLTTPAPDEHATHAEAYRDLTAPYWPCLFEWADPGFTGRLVDVRHPLFDVRLVNFVLSVPPLPWCADKELLRRAMASYLPDVIRLRRKAPLGGDPVAAAFAQRGTIWSVYLGDDGALAPYVDQERFRQITQNTRIDGAPGALLTRVVSLNGWLRQRKQSSSSPHLEKSHERPEAIARASEEGVSRSKIDSVWQPS